MDQRQQLPTGPWSGFYLESHQPRKGWMHLYLEFEDGKIKGEGTDYVGPWTLAGTTTRQQCVWVKQYVGQHQVNYQGVAGPEGIQGSWDIRGYATGEFHIWPATMSHLNELFLQEDLDREPQRPQYLGTVPNDPFV